MAAIRFIVEGTSVGTIEVRIEVPGDNATADTPSDSDRLLAYVLRNYGKDAEGADRTPQEAVQELVMGIVEGVRGNVHRDEQELAAKTARDAVTPITATPVAP